METSKQDSASVAGTEPESKKIRAKGFFDDKPGRLIIRNLQFDIKEKHLKQTFAKFGNILDVSVPLNPENNLNKGFGFVEFKTRDEARKAIEGMNAKQYKGRTVAVDFALSKKKYNRKIDEIIEKNPIKQKGKKDAEEKKGKKAAEDGNEEAPEELSECSNWDTDPEEEQAKKESVKKSVKDHKSKKPQAQSQPAAKDAAQAPEKKKNKDMKRYMNDAEEGLTLFVRNLDYSTTEQELKEFFQEHGEVYFARLVKSRENPEVHKGYAFVKFKSKEIVEKLAAASSEYWGEEKFKLSKAKQADLESMIEFKGRRLVMFKAESKSDRERSKEEKNVKVDKRNKDLLKVGLVTTKEFVHEGVSEKEMETRIRLFKKKQDSIKKNPNLFVSKTRLCMRELDRRMDEKSFAEFITSFVNDWKETLSFEDRKEIKTVKLVKQYKILMDKDNTNETGKPKSSGIGFVEVSDHRLAMYLVENLNNFIMNKKRGKGLVVDFALEDHRKLLKRKQKQENLKRKLKENKKEQEKLKKRDAKGKDIEEDAEEEKNKETIDQINDVEKLKELMKTTSSRGKKNRIKRKIQRLMGEAPTESRNAQKKISQKGSKSKAQKKAEEQQENEDEADEDNAGIELSQQTKDMLKKKMNESKQIEADIKSKIKRNLRKKKHLKQKQEEEYDDVFKHFENKINKRLKMIEDAGDEDQGAIDDREFADVEIEED